MAMPVQFALPARLCLGKNEPDMEVYTPEEAIDVLMGWPVQAGPLYQRALDDCFAATVQAEDCEVAYRSFVAFAKASNILAPDGLPHAPREIGLRPRKAH